MEQRGNKTIMCSVLFLDIVAYSKKSVSAQIAQKEQFNTMLANAIRNVPVNDRLILDTGDGAAVTFLGDVEDALKAVLAFRESLLGEGPNMDPPLQVCMGINLGPVRLVKDINGQPNIVGDGINVAQRIMGFAKPGQILVSRSYFDAASRLSQEYAGMFYSEGSRTDKHVREHEVYAIGKPDEATTARQQVGEDTLGKAVKHSTVEVAEGWLQSTLATLKNASGQQRALHVGIIASALALLIVVAAKIMHRPEVPALQLAAETQTMPVVTPEAVSAAPATNKAAAPKVVKKPKAARPADTPAGQADNKNLSSSHTRHEKTAKISTEATPGAMANVSIAVAPWGEIYLDGKKQGVSPPLYTLHVTPGEHAIEIRNTTFPPYTESIRVKAGEKKKIKHKFAN
jgi:class 3 adenylate cyclase